jgi:dihydrofolate synthase/folylpolyglutamate synthase
MLSTKDVTGYLKPLAKNALTLHGVSIPEEAATLSAQETVDAALSVGMDATVADTVAEAIADITSKDPAARILICGSLYLAGNILRDNA